MRTLSALLLLLPASAKAATWTVKAACGVLESNCFAEVAPAVDAAADGDLVEVHAGSYHLGFEVDGRTLTIRGVEPGAVLQSETGNLVDVRKNATLLLQNLVLDGGGVCVRVRGSSTATLEDVTLRNCARRGTGGALRVDPGSSATVLRASFEDNGSTASTGAHVYAEGTVRLEDVSFTGGEAEKGGIYVVSGSTTVERATFTANHAEVDGGAAYVVPGASFTCTDCTFTGNSAGGDGGHLYLPAGARVSLAGELSFTAGTATRGGALFGTLPFFRLPDIPFVENTASEDGGAVYWKGGTLRLPRATFTDNRAAGRGGALYTVDTALALSGVIEGTTGVADGPSEVHAADGGGLYLDGGWVELGPDLTWSGLRAVRGGALFVSAGTAMLSGAPFADNRAEQGGAVYVGGGVLLANAAVFEDNIASESGGTLYLAGGSTALQAVAFENQNGLEAAPSGGFVTALVPFGDVGSSYVRGQAADEGSGCGGAVLLRHPTGETRFSNSAFFENRSDGDGGAVCLRDTARALFETVTFERNEAAGMGGHLATSTTASRVTLRECTLTGGVAESGGAVYATYTDLSMSGCTLASNTATDDGGALYVGTGVSHVSVQGSTFTGNEAETGRGGAVCNLSAAPWDPIEDTVFSANVAGTRGGALYHQPDDRTIDLAIARTTFVGNQAGEDGGALSARELGDLVLDAVVFEQNFAADAGAVEVRRAEGFEISASTFCANEATDGDGGALWLQDAGWNGLASFHHNVVVENSAADRGGSLWLDSTVLSATNNHVLGSSARTSGGALYLRDSNVDLRNNLFAWTVFGSTVSVREGQLTNDFNAWFDNAPTEILPIGPGGLDLNETGDTPELTDYRQNGDCHDDDLRPAPTSPLIDAADPDPTYRDSEWNRGDIGAFGGAEAIRGDRCGCGSRPGFDGIALAIALFLAASRLRARSIPP